MSSELHAQQQQFCDYLRDSQQHAPPSDVAPERMAIYARLVRNNILMFLEKSFPVLHQIIAQSYWDELTRAFIRDWPLPSPFTRDVSREFVKFCQHQPHPNQAPPYLAAIAHYEWLELDLFQDPAPTPTDDIDPQGDVLLAIPCLSPWIRLAHYDYPVHQLSAAHPHSEQGDYYFLLFRQTNFEVAFLQLNAISAHLIELLQHNVDACGAACLQTISQQFPQVPADAVTAGGQQTLQQWQQLGIILGTVSRTS